VYPICKICGHTRAEHGLLGSANEYPYPCDYRNCKCENYVAADDTQKYVNIGREKNVAAVKTFPVELSELNQDVAVFSWGVAHVGYGGFFQTTMNRTQWDDLGRPLKLRVVIFDD